MTIPTPNSITVEGAPVVCDAYLPAAEPTASIVVVHGLAEHAQRYARVAGALTDQGWAVYAYDLRGHGRSAASDEDLGFFAEQDGWTAVVEDLRKVVDAVRQAHPNVPLAVVSHSMGSFILQDYLARFEGAGLNAAVLSGTAGPPPPVAVLGRGVARIERIRQGPKGRSTLIDNLAFGAYNKSFEHRTGFEWLSRDPAEVDKYVEDPHCGFNATNQLWIDLLDAVASLAKPERLARIPKTLPIYLFCGSRDPVSDGSKSVRKLHELYEKAGLSSELKVYEDGRHEMLNETNRDEVTSDLVDWLARQLG